MAQQNQAVINWTHRRGISKYQDNYIQQAYIHVERERKTVGQIDRQTDKETDTEAETERQRQTKEYVNTANLIVLYFFEGQLLELSLFELSLLDFSSLEFTLLE